LIEPARICFLTILLFTGTEGVIVDVCVTRREPSGSVLLRGCVEDAVCLGDFERALLLSCVGLVSVNREGAERKCKHLQVLVFKIDISFVPCGFERAKNKN
jgi:hypothetical protein